MENPWGTVESELEKNERDTVHSGCMGDELHDQHGGEGIPQMTDEIFARQVSFYLLSPSTHLCNQHSGIPLVSL